MHHHLLFNHIRECPMPLHTLFSSHASQQGRALSSLMQSNQAVSQNQVRGTSLLPFPVRLAASAFPFAHFSKCCFVIRKKVGAWIFSCHKKTKQLNFSSYYLLLYCTGGRKTWERDALQWGAWHDMEWKDLKEEWRDQRKKSLMDIWRIKAFVWIFWKWT